MPRTWNPPCLWHAGDVNRIVVDAVAENQVRGS